MLKKESKNETEIKKRTSQVGRMLNILQYDLYSLVFNFLFCVD